MGAFDPTEPVTNQSVDTMLVPDPVIESSVVGMIVIVLIDTLCILGNFILAVSYIKHPPPDIRVKSMFSIVCACLCIGLIHVPISLVLIVHPDLMDNHVWMCQTVSWIQNYCALNFVTNMDLVTVCTYITIAYPLHSPSWLTSRNYKIALSCAWGFPAVVSTIPVTVNAVNLAGDDTMPCAPVAQRFPFLATMVLIFGFVLPSLAFHLTIQARIFCIAKKQAKEIEKARYLNFDTGDVESRQRTKGFRLMAVYVTSFLVVWVPMSVVLLLESFCPDCLRDTLSLVLLSLGNATAATLPLVFSAASTLNRDSVRKTLSMVRKRKETQMA